MGKLQKDQSGFGVVEGLLILVIVAVLGFVGWYVWQSKNKTDSVLNKTAKTNVVAATKKPSQTNPVKAGSDTAATDNAPAPASNLSADDIKAAHDAILADCAKDPSFTCSITAGDDRTAPNFVQSQVSLGSSGYAALAKNINGKWTVIWTGQNCIDKTIVDKYSVPATFNVCTS